MTNPFDIFDKRLSNIENLLLDIKHPVQVDPDKLLSPKETGEMLSIDVSTLYRWDKLGYLTKIKIGGKVRYRLSDIQKLFSGGQNDAADYNQGRKARSK
jgi:hypothetical protein